MASPFSLGKAIVNTARQLYERGMLVGTEGNISARLDDNRIMITPSGLAKGGLSPEDMVIVDINGKQLQGRNQPSSELLMHLYVYKTRPDVGACVHSHPPYTTAFAVAGIPLAEDVLPEVVLFIGSIPLTDYAMPGTDAVPESLAPYAETGSAFVLRNHGLLTVGCTLEEAFNCHETVEHYAHILFLARQLGNIETIPPDDFRRLEEMRRKFEKTWSNKP